MEELTGERAIWYVINTAMAEFVHNVLPLRSPYSQEALTCLMSKLKGLRAPAPIMDAALIQCLAIIEPHSHRLPSLIDRYVSQRRQTEDSLAIFSACIRDVLTYRGIGNPLVQRAIATIEDSYCDSNLRETAVASRLGVRPAALSIAFKQQTGFTFGDYLRGVRLVRAAGLLVTTDKSVKEVWSTVGYNFASNFDHDFKKRFGVTPREYRAQGLRPVVLDRAQGPSQERAAGPQVKVTARPKVLIVDDDEGWRLSIGKYLELEGFAVVRASTGGEALDLVGQMSFDAILLDYHLSDTSGLNWLTAVRKRQSKVPPVALISADIFLSEQEVEVRALGASLASKVCDLQEIKSLVTGLMSQS